MYTVLELTLNLKNEVSDSIRESISHMTGQSENVVHQDHPLFEGYNWGWLLQEWTPYFLIPQLLSPKEIH